VDGVGVVMDATVAVVDRIGDDRVVLLLDDGDG